MYVEGKSGHCSGFAVGLNTYLTAAHCLEVTGTEPIINGKIAQFIKRDDKNDLMLLTAETSTILQIAKDEPVLGQDVITIGWPGAWVATSPLPFFGHVQAVDVPMAFEDMQAHRVNLFHEGGGGGMSGGPIVAQDGTVVGMCEAQTRYPSVSIASPTVKVIRKFLGFK